MKNIILISAIIFSFTSSIFSQTRNTLWLDGLSTTSLGWENTSGALEGVGYDLYYIPEGSVNNSGYNPELGVIQAASNLESNIDNYDDILGIGHDFGGLVLRQMATGNNSLNAILLDGVPNHGSHGIEFAISTAGVSGKTKAERIIEGVNLIKAGEDCNNCEFIQTFEGWVGEMKSNQSVFSEMLPNSDVITILNQPENMPQVPHAVFWGSIDEFSITSMMSSWYFPETGDEDHFTKCYTEALNRAREDAKDQFTISTISNTTGFFDKALGFVTSFISGDPISGTLNILNAATDFINDSKTEILAEIEAVKDKDEELARILRCELANQLLATEWEFALIQNGNFTTQVVEDMPTHAECLEYCRDDCDNGQGPTNCMAHCMSDCLAGTSPLGGVVDVTVFVAEENDGLLNKSEQLLAGEEKLYHLSNTNHFQETKLGYGDLADHIQDLFDGGAGAAFVVNKN